MEFKWAILLSTLSKKWRSWLKMWKIIIWYFRVNSFNFYILDTILVRFFRGQTRRSSWGQMGSGEEIESFDGLRRLRQWGGRHGRLNADLTKQEVTWQRTRDRNQRHLIRHSPCLNRRGQVKHPSTHQLFDPNLDRKPERHQFLRCPF